MATEYEQLLKDPKWFSKRENILNRDKHKCRNCGSTAILQVHHRQYHADKITGEMVKPWDYDNKYLITFCEKCHKAGHSKYKVPTYNI